MEGSIRTLDLFEAAFAPQENDISRMFGDKLPTEQASFCFFPRLLRFANFSNFL